MTSPGFTSLALTQALQTTNQVDQNEREADPNEGYEDNLSLLTHPLYQQISDLDRQVTKQYQAACCEGVPGVDSNNLEPLDTIMQRYQFIKLSVENQLNKPLWQSLREYCPYQSQEPLPQECTLMIESLFSQDKLKDQMMSSSLDDQLENTFFEYLIEYCRENYPQGQCPLIENTDLSSIEYFALPPSFNEHEILKDRLNKIFLQYFIEEFLEGFLETCSNQISIPEECVQIEGHARSPFFDNNIMFIGLTLSIAHKIILTQIYLGSTINEIDFSPFTLSINQNVYSDKNIAEGCTENTDSLNSEFQKKSGILLRTKTEYEHERGQCHYNIQLDPSLFVTYQFLIETSRNSDHSLIQLVFYPLLENYYNSLVDIQRLKGIGLENVSSPNVSTLPQNISFSINTSIVEMIRRERREIFLEQNFRIALREALNTLIDGNAEWQQTRLFTKEVLDDLANEIEMPIPNNLRKNIHQAEFSDDFHNRLISNISSYSEENFYCTNCETHSLENYKETGLHKTLMRLFLNAKFENIWNSTIVEGRVLRPGINAAIAQTIQRNYFTRDPFADGQQLSGEYLRLIENLESLVDQWIEKALEVMVSSREQLAQLIHQVYIEEIIQEANRISLVDDSRLSTYALYQAVISQKDFPTHPEVSALLNTLFLSSPSYTDARIRFNSLLQLSSRPIELADDINHIPSENVDNESTNKDGDSGEQTDSIGQTTSESNLNEPARELVGLTDEQISRTYFGNIDDESTNEHVDHTSSKDDDLNEPTNEGTDQIASESNLDEPTGELVVLTDEQINRIYFGNVDSDLNEQTDENTGQAAFEDNLDEQSKQETVFSTTNQESRQQVINPNQIRETLKKATLTTFNTSILQKSAEQDLDAQKRFTEHLLVVGEDMGFFDESLIPDGQFEEEPASLIRDTVFSRLGPVQRGLLNPCNYISFPFCDSEAQVYLDIYKEGQKDEILNRHRILSDRYSPVAGKPLFEIIQDNCHPQKDPQRCRSRVSNIMIEALEKQEQEIKDNFQELMTDLTSEDPSEALRKVMFVLEEDEEQGGAFTNIHFQLEQNHRVQFDFHSDRLQEHLMPSEREKFIQNYIDTPTDNLMKVLFLLILPSLIRSASGVLAGPAGRLGYNSKASAMRQFASRNTSRGWLTTIFIPAFGYTLYRDISHHYNNVVPKADFIEDLYYVSPQQSLLVDQAQFLMSEQLESQSYFDAVTIPIIIVASVIGILGFLGARHAWTLLSNKNLEKQVRSLGGHFERLGINSPAAESWSNMRAWDMRALKEKADLLKYQNAGNSRAVKSIKKSWKAINRFYKRQTGRAQRLMEARRQLGAPTDISSRDVMQRYIENQIANGNGNLTHLRNLQKTLQREEDLFRLQRYNNGDHPIIQGFFEHLRTLP